MTAASISRRDLFKISVLGAAVVALPMERVARAKSLSRIDSKKLPRPYTVPFAVPPELRPDIVDEANKIAYYTIRQMPKDVEILPGVKTPMFTYNGTVPGPTISVPKGMRTVVRQINDLPAIHPTLKYVPWTSTHLHGSASKPQFDGYANDITLRGQYKDYEYPNSQAARTLWYHDHGVGHTAENVYHGLAGLYQLNEAVDGAVLGLPKGPYDVPLILGDAAFASNGTLLFDDNDRSEAFGDVILVNGRPWPVMQVQRRKYRFRILDACVSRGFRLYLSNGDPMTVIGTDAGLVPYTQDVSELRIGMAERYEIVIDFAKYEVGKRIELRNRGVQNSVNFDNTSKVMAFDIVDGNPDLTDNECPKTLNPTNRVMTALESESVKTRKLRVKKDDIGTWTIADMTWQDVVDSDFTKVFADPEPNTVEIWEIENSSGGWFHPVHIHLVDFRILSRNGRPPRPEELGPKDVVYVGEDETVRILIPFGPEQGRYMMHCHNLVHEDHDMMTQFEVGKNGEDPLGTPAKLGPPPPWPVPAQAVTDPPPAPAATLPVLTDASGGTLQPPVLPQPPKQPDDDRRRGRGSRGRST